MQSVKQEARELIEQLPDDVSFDDMLYQLYMLEKLKRAAEAIAAGKFYTQDEVERTVETWHTK